MNDTRHPALLRQIYYFRSPESEKTRKTEKLATEAQRTEEVGRRIRSNTRDSLISWLALLNCSEDRGPSVRTLPSSVPLWPILRILDFLSIQTHQKLRVRLRLSQPSNEHFHRFYRRNTLHCAA